MKRLIIINGPPASGKTTLLNRLEAKLGWMAIAKDDIKESVLDALEQSSEEDNLQLSNQIFEGMSEAIEEQVLEGDDFIVEGNFKTRFSGEMNRLLAKGDYSVLQIFCHADGDILIKRFQDRILNGNRHKGHGGVMDMAHIRRTGQMEPLDINATLIDYDNSNNERFDYTGVKNWVEKHDLAQ